MEQKALGSFHYGEETKQGLGKEKAKAKNGEAAAEHQGQRVL